VSSWPWKRDAIVRSTSADEFHERIIWTPRGRSWSRLDLDRVQLFQVSDGSVDSSFRPRRKCLFDGRPEESVVVVEEEVRVDPSGVELMLRVQTDRIR
jgi:hypothetical protein